MRVIIHDRVVRFERAGVGRYTRELMRALARRPELSVRSEAGPITPFNHPIVDRLVRRVRRFGLATLESATGPQADIHHFPTPFVTAERGGRVIATVHDVAFLECPETIEPKHRRQLERWMPTLSTRAHAVITVSEYGAARLRETFPDLSDRIFVTPLASEWRAERPADPLRAESEVSIANEGTGRPYLLHIGTIEPRKRIRFLLEVFRSYQNFDGDLIVVGAPGWNCATELKELRRARQDRVVHLDRVDDIQLKRLIRGASALVSTSCHEGFGLPVAEAIGLECPAVAGDHSAYREYFADLAVLVAGWTPEVWHAAIDRAIALRQQPDETKRRATTLQSRLSWAETAARTVSAYRAV